jgi:enterochelin esterase-like enzyme
MSRLAVAVETNFHATPRQECTMNHFFACGLGLILVVSTTAAEPPADRPAPSAVRGSQHPLLHADGTVTFRVISRDARQVQIVPRGNGNGLGDVPLDLRQEPMGVWTVRAPVRPGFHYYHLRVDGYAGNDPASQTFFGWAQESSGLEVPDPSLDFYTLTDIPHGEVRIATYHARTTGGPRRAYVYTPPGYDEQPTRRYPVLYLQHGAGESERAWTEQGKANVILDNLIAAGRAEPMLIVMENGYATPPSQPAAAPRPGQQDPFADLVVNDLVPFIDGKFRTLASRDQRAIAGLSMGGGQAMRIGLTHLDKFASVGSFSGAIRDFNIETSYGGALRDAAEVNRRLRLLWIGCGTEDRLIQGARQLHESLAQNKIEHIWVEGPGSHEWQVWRKHLYDFAPRLFCGRQ